RPCPASRAIRASTHTPRDTQRGSGTRDSPGGVSPSDESAHGDLVVLGNQWFRNRVAYGIQRDRPEFYQPGSRDWSSWLDAGRPDPGLDLRRDQLLRNGNRRSLVLRPRD